ncbi:MAG: inositol monophosphatase family protein [Gemmatimonadales bacterium]|nr:MAG: inositol monophosphatase family protein [Gemmatimonadales bacterium]
MKDTDFLRTLHETALALAHAAGEVTLAHFGARVPDEAKADGSPVTRADREAETLLRRRIRERFPDHGILGEEFGEETGTAPVRWILDPIDGTRSFMRGVPLYGVLIGIEVEGEPVVGVAHFPALGETVSAARGQGCRWQEGEASVNDVEDLSRAVVLTSDSEMTRTSRLCPGWLDLLSEVDYLRSWGDAYGHALVATGRAEIMIDSVLSPWDAAPLLTILEEAGGRFTDLRGGTGIEGGSGLSTNGRLHDRVLALLAGSGGPY